MIFSRNELYGDAPNFWQLGFQDPATPIMEGIIDLHHDLFFFLIMVCVFVSSLLLRTINLFSEKGLTENFLFGMYYWYRLPSRMTHHTALEIIWTVIPSIILLGIAIPSFSLLYAIDEIVNPILTVKIIGHQWYWSYEYGDPNYNKNSSFSYDSYMVPDDDILFGHYRLLETDNSLILPIKTQIRLIVTSADVLHSWAVPSLGIKMDACPGRLNQVSLFIKREGTFYGQCSEICGVNHGFMPIKVDALKPEFYETFVSLVKKK